MCVLHSHMLTRLWKNTADPVSCSMQNRLLLITGMTIELEPCLRSNDMCHLNIPHFKLQLISLHLRGEIAT